MYREAPYIIPSVAPVEKLSDNDIRGDRFQEVFNSIRINKAGEKLVVCITLYNESGKSLFASLFAISKAIDYLYKRVGNTDMVSVCIVADGLDKIAGSTLKLLDSLKIKSGGQVYSEYGVTIYDNWVRIKDIVTYSNDYALGNKQNTCCVMTSESDTNTGVEAVEQKDNNYRILLIIKDKNKGKLDSHWWFFKIVCQKLNPNYCFQLDCGTVPNDESLFLFVKHLKQNSTVGAVASRVLVASPSNEYNLLHTWQYGDFAAQKLFDWPAEILSGYLTVIPGQFCVFRWQALLSDNKLQLFGKDKNQTPLDNYFRGLGNLGPFESNMFLAEDRILGYEIISRKGNKWQLDYLPDVVALTDPCDTLSELFLQRRRWINSSFACNLWLIFKIFHYLKESGANIIQKIHTVCAIPWLLINCLLQWCMPAVILLIAKPLLKIETVNQPIVISFLLQNISLLIFSITMSLQVTLFYKGLNKKNEKIIIGTTTIQVLVVLFGSILLIANQDYFSYQVQLSAIILTEAAVLLFTSALLAVDFTRSMLKNVFQFLFIRPFMLMLLTMYSFSNLHDCSWGTKGLNSPIKRSADQAELNIQSKFKRFRTTTFGSWMITNLLIILYFLYLPDVSQKRFMQMLVMFILSFTGYKMIAAILFSITPKLKTKN